VALLWVLDQTLAKPKGKFGHDLGESPQVRFGHVVLSIFAL